MILQIGIEPSQILELTPNSPLLYGFVILLLLAAIYYLHAQNEKKQQYLQIHNEKTYEALTAIKDKLQDIKSHSERKDITDNHIVSFLEEIKRKLESNHDNH